MTTKIKSLLLWVFGWCWILIAWWQVLQTCNAGMLTPPLYRSFTGDQPGSLKIIVPPGYSLRGKGSSHVGSEVLVSSQTHLSAPSRTLPRIPSQFPGEKRHLKRMRTLQEAQVKDLHGEEAQGGRDERSMPPVPPSPWLWWPRQDLGPASRQHPWGKVKKVWLGF